MAKRRTTSRNSKKRNNSFVVFLIVVIILALLSFAISYFMLNRETEINSPVSETESPEEGNQGDAAAQEQDLTEMTHLQGTWVSNYDGTMLTIEGRSCTFESPSVDSPEKVKGSLQVNKTIVTFVFTGNNSCGSSEGHYEYQKEAGGEVFFKRIKDPCESRSRMMSVSWFRL